MKKLKDDPAIHIYDMDKNLGPAAIGKQVYEEHLTSSMYFRFNEKECKELNNETRIKIKLLFHDKCRLPKSELTYLKRAIKSLKLIMAILSR
jgi:hypothetical protein